MNRNINIIWDVVNGLVAAAICYTLIFEEQRGKFPDILLIVFFVSLAARSVYNRRLSGKK